MTTQITTAAPIPRPITQPRVADSGKGSITTSHEQRIRSSFFALPCGLGFLESHLPVVQGGLQC